MVRNYKPKSGHRQYRKYDPEIMKKAYKEVLNGEGSIAKVAKKYNITKSCLHGRIHYKRNKPTGGQRAFTLEREEHIIKYIHACAPWQNRLQFWDIRYLIKFYLDRRPVLTKRKLENNLPGQELVSKLTQRQEDIIQQKIIQSITDNGVVTAEAILSYFHELRMLICGLEPQNIVSFNDILIAEESVTNKIKETDNLKINNLFLMLAASATGEMLPPYFSHQEKPCYERSPRRSIMSKHPHKERKKLNTIIFEEWFKSTIIPYYEGKSGKKCLIGSFFSSRITKNILEMCNERNINFVFLPDNSNHLTQPLHHLTELIRSTWSSTLSQMRTDGTLYTMPKDSFCPMIESLIANASDTVSEGFKNTGIHPFNPEGVLKQLPNYNETTIEDLDENFENCDTGLEDETVQVKTETEWNEQYSDDEYDDEIANNCVEVTVVKTDNQYNQTPLEGIRIKLSPVDFLDENKDYSVEYTSQAIDSVSRSSKGRKSKSKSKDDSSDSDYTPIPHKMPTSKTRAKYKKMSSEESMSNKSESKVFRNIEKDPLLSCQSGTNLKIHENISENDALTNTQLLEAILSTVTRQEKLQERATVAIEAQTQALTDIARLLERQAACTNMP